MTTTFRNLTDLQKHFNSEQVCREFLEQARWNGNVICPHCGINKKPYRIKDGNRFKCSDKDCGKKFSAISGTIFENTKLPLQKWFLAIYLVSAHKKGISSLQLGRDLGISPKSAWFVLHRVREMLRENNPLLLQGTVAIDETYIGGKEANKHQTPAKIKKRLGTRKNFKGRPLDKAAVLGLVQEGGNLVHQVLPSTKKSSIYPVIEKHVAKGSTMVTDEWNTYRALTKHGYEHKSVMHKLNIYVKDGFHTNTIEGAFSLLKRGIIGIYHSVSPKHLQRYCDEFSYRYNTRTKTEADRFGHSITQAHGRRLTYNQLIKKVTL